MKFEFRQGLCKAPILCVSNDLTLFLVFNIQYRLGFANRCSKRSRNSYRSDAAATSMSTR
jgi:hypothetical protein